MDNLVAFRCSRCDLLFYLARTLIDVVNMCFIDEKEVDGLGGGIHCPQCRNNSSVGYGYVREGV